MSQLCTSVCTVTVSCDVCMQDHIHRRQGMQMNTSTVAVIDLDASDDNAAATAGKPT